MKKHAIGSAIDRVFGVYYGSVIKTSISGEVNSRGGCVVFAARIYRVHHICICIQLTSYVGNSRRLNSRRN